MKIQIVVRLTLLIWIGLTTAVCFDTASGSDRNSTPTFENVTHEVGLRYRGQTFALVAADFDADGWVDLGLSNHLEVLLMRNHRGHFVEATKVSGAVQVDSHGLSWLDFDSDSRLDLLISVGAERGTGRGENLVLTQDDAHIFHPLAGIPASIMDSLGRGRCSLILDFNGDGFPDIALMNAVQPGRMHRFMLGGAEGFSENTEQSGLGEIQAECLSAVYFQPEAAPYFVAYGPGSDSGRIFQFSKEGRFVDRSVELGHRWQGPIQAAAAGDFDNDGDIDLYFVRGTGNPSDIEVRGESEVLFRLLAGAAGERVGLKISTSGPVSIDLRVAGLRMEDSIRIGPQGQPPQSMPFKVIPESFGLGAPPSMDSANPGCYVWSEETGTLRVELIGDGARTRFSSGIITGGGKISDAKMTGAVQVVGAQTNRLLQYDAGKLTDVTDRAGVGDTSSGRDAAFFDADNDGDLDLFVVNSGSRIRNLPDIFYLNDGDGTFSDVSEAAGIASGSDGRSQSLIPFDYNNDGFVDVFSANGDGPWPGNDGPLVLWANGGGKAHAGEIRLQGCGQNLGGFGTRLVVRNDDSPLALQHAPTSSRFSSSVVPVHIGMGQLDSVRLEVFWPSGISEEVALHAGESLVLTAPSCRCEKPG